MLWVCIKINFDADPILFFDFDVDLDPDLDSAFHSFHSLSGFTKLLHCRFIEKLEKMPNKTKNTVP